MTKHIKTICSLLKQHGFKIDSMRTKRHFVLKVTHRTGVKRVFTVAGSPGDIHSYKNFERLVNRTAQQLIAH